MTELELRQRIVELEKQKLELEKQKLEVEARKGIAINHGLIAIAATLWGLG